MKKLETNSYPPRGRAWRRAQRERAVQYAVPVVMRNLNYLDRGDALRKAAYFADNLKKCRCSMCRRDRYNRAEANTCMRDAIDAVSDNA